MVDATRPPLVPRDIEIVPGMSASTCMSVEDCDNALATVNEAIEGIKERIAAHDAGKHDEGLSDFEHHRRVMGALKVKRLARHAVLITRERMMIEAAAQKTSRNRRIVEDLRRHYPETYADILDEVENHG